MLSAYAISLQSFSIGSRSTLSSNRFHTVSHKTDCYGYLTVVVLNPGSNEQAYSSVREVVHQHRIDVRWAVSLLELYPYHWPPGIIECVRDVQEHQLHILPGRGPKRVQHYGQRDYSRPPLCESVLTI
ncbi:hypothetical protein EVAR_95242_1 [Eumeta japonica]|uniref:Uncharacterized protein n=1 Tax=Eumeta variegata TaxID=151549 RepID=A0A4C1UJW7_EUMVA|nr:hypothetical protein EVAR_95242_1 [Eumeta japonica]